VIVLYHHEASDWAPLVAPSPLEQAALSLRRLADETHDADTRRYLAGAADNITYGNLRQARLECEAMRDAARTRNAERAVRLAEIVEVIERAEVAS